MRAVSMSKDRTTSVQSNDFGRRRNSDRTKTEGSCGGVLVMQTNVRADETCSGTRDSLVGRACKYDIHASSSRVKSAPTFCIYLVRELAFVSAQTLSISKAARTSDGGGWPADE